MEIYSIRTSNLLITNLIFLQYLQQFYMSGNVFYYDFKPSLYGSHFFYNFTFKNIYIIIYKNKRRRRVYDLSFFFFLYYYIYISLFVKIYYIYTNMKSLKLLNLKIFLQSVVKTCKKSKTFS